MSRLHEYVEKDGTYLIKIKVNTDDTKLQTDLVDFFMRPMMRNTDLLPGCTVEAFYKHNLEEEELILDARTKFVESAVDSMKEALEDINLMKINLDPEHYK